MFGNMPKGFQTGIDSVKQTAIVLAALAAASILLFGAQAGLASNNGAGNSRPMFLRLQNSGSNNKTPGIQQLPQWTGSFTDRTGKRVNFTMAGTDPSIDNGGTTTTINLVLIPVKAVYGANNGNRKFDPLKHKVQNGLTVVENTVASPVFAATTDFIQGGTDLGFTQYIDAFQRGNFWNASVFKNPAYHVLFNVTLGTELKIDVSQSQGKVIQNPFSDGMVGTFDINAFDQQVQSYVRNFANINPGVLPVFLTEDMFLTVSGNCCVGGYRSSNGGPPSGQTYIYATYIDQPKSFARDVSALARELGSWMDDPFLYNAVNCSDIGDLDVGAALDGKRHEYAYNANSFTYHLPSLVFLGYFGAPKSVSVNRWLSFQGDERHRCAGQ